MELHYTACEDFSIETFLAAFVGKKAPQVMLMRIPISESPMMLSEVWLFLPI